MTTDQTKSDLMGLGVPNALASYLVDNLLRDKLTTSRTYFVRADGNNNNDGSANTAAKAFLTIQKAVDTVYGLDINGNNITISVAAGTYTGSTTIRGPLVGQKGATFLIQGNFVTPANVLISTTSANCFTVDQNAVVSITGFKMRTTTSGDCVNINNGAYVALNANQFDTCAGLHISNGAVCQITGNYSISGGAVGHWHCGSQQSFLTMGSPTITITNTPAFSSYFAGVAEGEIFCPTCTFSGSATGKRFLAHYGGVINATGQGLTYLPGDVAGEASDGGIYIGTTILVNVVSNSAQLVQSNVSMNDGTAGQTATLTNAPTSGNPTKWIPINDNGTTRYIPAW